jgi:4-carboxymuconolactone decarboxylase
MRAGCCVGILTALGRPQELGIYVKGALASGVTVDEIREILIHATVYCGTPAGHQAFLAAHEALKREGATLTSSSDDDVPDVSAPS